MDSPEKLAALGTQDTRRRQEKQKSQHNMCWTPSYIPRHKIFSTKKKDIYLQSFVVSHDKACDVHICVKLNVIK